MLNPDNEPVTHAQLDQFLAVVTAGVDLDHHPETTTLIIAVGRGETVCALVVPQMDDPGLQERVDTLLRPRARLAAVVSIVGWAPVEDPIATAWLVVAVGRGGLGARFVVRRVAEDDHWTDVDPHEAPWTALSTAGGLRAAIEQGETLRLKTGAHPDLYKPPSELPGPPVDDQGDL